MNKKAIVLLSGGIDSSTTLAIARDEGYACYALTLRYGQRHEREIEAAKRVAEAMNVVKHIVLDIDLRAFGGSALTDEIEVPKHRSADEIGQEIPATYVPARNTVFLAFARAWAESIGAADIFIGVSAIDYSGYPDCRPEFIDAFQRLANLATKAGVESRPFRIHAPLIRMSKSETIRTGTRLGVDYSLTHSCYDPDDEGRACGQCDSCLLR
ncbi:MAG TPA: 7-cyano-7-deazaguanine synthase QueC [Planctomycetaceae bacterium]|nr:7-cyano-7-deazaguanine synthase QueC [Planctomycetaceae bacterium]